ncbi:MAG: UDP-N-acetylglucosamine--N-acetylmuramyl-(pentapeptide) pyrophosphoryl-undecaprenol N-acetylglucosamine transferase [Elusimicrobia bacterium]|nr:UDP-N-acetylglucosamine--N-acetylmuramyl-(pentapeptide) pyrophosphoryl-undecaprenol N-acetylglucosamine transferase [Elusimicrobiota bacterium]
MRFIIACGGTGGHFYPGYALGKALIGRGHEALFLLRKDDPAGPRLAAEDLPFAELDLRGLPRRPTLELAAVFFKLLGSLRVARNILKAFRPEAVAGMGGYLSFPLSAAAAMGRVPLILHESNSVPGLANRLCLPFAESLALGLPLKAPLSSSVPMRLIGTPIREELWLRRDPGKARGALELDPGRRTLLVFGGSQGASSINQVLPQGLGLLKKRGAELQVLHLAGRKDAPEVQRLYDEAGIQARALAYLDAMHLAYAAADLAVCRSGAATLAELAAQAKPALLIPYPAATAGHQEANAAVFERAGAAKILMEPFSADSLAQALGTLLDEPQSLSHMSSAYARIGLPGPQECVRMLADLAEQAARKKA